MATSAGYSSFGHGLGTPYAAASDERYVSGLFFGAAEVGCARAATANRMLLAFSVLEQAPTLAVHRGSPSLGSGFSHRPQLAQ